MVKIAILALFLSIPSYAKDFTIPDKRKIIAVIDTGVAKYQVNKKYMCKGGVFSSLKDDGIATHPHGPNVISIIHKNLDSNKYCIVSIKFLNTGNDGSNMKNFIWSVKLASRIKNLFLVNISAGGAIADESEIKLEIDGYRKILKKGAYLVVAAGNDHNDLDKQCNFFPACYKNEIKNDKFIVVGSMLYSSNYGSIVKAINSGNNVGFPPMNGTSQAAAQESSKILNKEGI
jgi:hypothetical protein